MKRLLWIIRKQDRGYGLRKVMRRLNTYAFRSKQIRVVESVLLAQEIADSLTPQPVQWVNISEGQPVPLWYGYVEEAEKQ